MRRILALTLAVLMQITSAAANSSDDWSQSITAQDAQADLEALYAGLKSAHYNLFFNTPEADYDELFTEKMAALKTPISRLDLWRTLQEFTAYGSVAHAKIDFPADAWGAFRENGGKAFPIYLRIVEGRAYVGEDFSGSDAVSAGDEILALDGEPMSEWLELTSQTISADTPYIAHSLLEATFPMYLWLELGEVGEFELDLRKNNNRAMKAKVSALSYDELLAAIESAPENFSLDFNTRDARILEDGVAYLRPGPFYNAENPERLWDNTAVVDFVNGAFESFIEADAQALVLDLRANPGGDNSFSDPIIAWVADKPFRFSSKFLVRSSDEAAASNQARLDANPGAVEGVSGLYAKAFEATPRGETFAFDIPLADPRDGEQFVGDVYVLVNRNSYSNAVNTAAIFQDYGWGKIAGELTADFATTYGAMEHFTLPHSGFRVSFPKAYIIRPSGDETPGGVQPEIEIETPIVPTADDAVLNQLIGVISGK